jgi:hypothetical protein
MREIGLSGDDKAKRLMDQLGCDVGHGMKPGTDNKMQDKECDAIRQRSNRWMDE